IATTEQQGQDASSEDEWEEFAPVIEEGYFAAQREGSKSACTRANLADSRGTGEGRIVHEYAEREVGRRHGRSDEKIPGFAWAESFGKAGRADPRKAGAGLPNRWGCGAGRTAQFFFTTDEFFCAVGSALASTSNQECSGQWNVVPPTGC